MEFECSPCVCVASPQVLQIHLTTQKPVSLGLESTLAKAVTLPLSYDSWEGLELTPVTPSAAGREGIDPHLHFLANYKHVIHFKIFLYLDFLAFLASV